MRSGCALDTSHVARQSAGQDAQRPSDPTRQRRPRILNGAVVARRDAVAGVLGQYSVAGVSSDGGKPRFLSLLCYTRWPMVRSACHTTPLAVLRILRVLYCVGHVTALSHA